MRAANTRHGRYSREHLALERLIREFQMNGIRSARAMRDPKERALFFHIARSERCSPRILEQMREMARADLAREEQPRLREKALGS